LFRVSFEFFPSVSINVASFEIEFCKVSFDSADIQKTPPGYISWKSQAYSMESVVLPQPPSPEMLLVLDNVDGEEVSGNIKELILGAWKQCSCGHFIITSRRNSTEINDSAM
jgi:hypothetical protein